MTPKDTLISEELLKSLEPPSIDLMFDLATSRYGVEPDEAAEYVERFMVDINRSINM